MKGYQIVALGELIDRYGYHDEEFSDNIKEAAKQVRSIIVEENAEPLDEMARRQL